MAKTKSRQEIISEAIAREQKRGYPESEGGFCIGCGEEECVCYDVWLMGQW
jgi:hypothetical protein